MRQRSNDHLKHDGKNYRKMIHGQFFKVAKGHGEEEARRRFDIIEMIFGDLQRQGCSEWTNEALLLADEIRKGGSLVNYEPPLTHQGAHHLGRIIKAKTEQVSDLEFSKIVQDGKSIKIEKDISEIIEDFPSVEFTEDNPYVGNYKDSLEEKLQDIIVKIRAINKSDSADLILTEGTLHKAIKDYQNYRLADFTHEGQVNQTGHFINGLLNRILKKTEDIHLSKLNFSKCQSIVDYFRNRPDGLEKETCAKTIQILMRFLLWLKKSSAYGWKIDNLDELDKKVKALPSDRQKLETIKVVGFSQLEIYELIKNSSETELALILLGLNCGYGAGESGRLTTQHLYLDQEHPEAEKLQDLKSFGIQNWIRMKRPKNNVLNAQLLWLETAEAIKNLGVSDGVIFRTSTGAPMYRENSKNAQSTFSNYFRRLLEQCDTKSLSFGKLRKHFSTWLRNKGESELASMAVQHGNPTEDKLLHHYSNKPYKRYFEAQVEYRLYLGIEEAVRNRGLKD